MGQPLCILCPGQGAQIVGMAKDIAEKYASAKAVFQEADAVLGFSLSQVCFEGPQEKLNQTDMAQPGIYVAGVACYRAAVESGKINPDDAKVFAGLSLGEYTALHLGGAFSFADGLRLVAARGRYMQEASVASPSGMVALIGADETSATAVCAEAAQGEVLVPANFNSPGQVVISGHLTACARAVQVAEAKGLKAISLPVAGAFHSPLMQSAADRMGPELAKAQIASPKVPVYANVTAEIHADPTSIRNLLVSQIVKPVRWAASMEKLVAANAYRFVELAPGKALAGMLKKVNRRAEVDNLATVDNLTV